MGKTSFIRYLLGRDFPGQRIGPEPTTDRFTVLLNGPDERTIPGNALSVHPELPFRGLERFGVSFLSRLEGSQLPSSVLRSITLIDTPGILSGEKQRMNRGYDFTKVISWYAEKADLVILLFDAHKLDISDELKGAIDVLKGHEDKIRCILNKADQIDKQQLMRVYGALLWSLGKTMTSPEVARVYVGSFWQEPLANMDNAELFEMEEKDLMKDLAILPRQSAVRKINELVKRIRKVKTLAYIIGYLKAQMPAMMGKDKKQKKLIADLPNVFRSIMKKHNLSAGDFPDINKFSEKLNETKFADFATLSEKKLEELDRVLNVDIPKLMEVSGQSRHQLLLLRPRAFSSLTRFWHLHFASFRNYRVRRTRQILSRPSWGFLGRVLRTFPCLRQRKSLVERKKPSKATRLDSQKRTKTGFGKFCPYRNRPRTNLLLFLQQTHDPTLLLSIGRFRIPRIAFFLVSKHLVRKVAFFLPRRHVMSW